MADEEYLNDGAEASADGPRLNALDRKITDVFPGFTVRKDLVSKVKGNALVPTYVLEFLLSSYAAASSRTITCTARRRTSSSRRYVRKAATASSTVSR